MYLNFYQKKIGLKAQTPTNESTKEENFCKYLVFFSFSSSALFWLYYFNMLNKPHIIETESKIWTKCPDSDARVHNTGNFLWNLNFFFIFFLRITLTTVFYKKYFLNMLKKPHNTDTESKIWLNSPDSDARVQIFLWFSICNVGFVQHIKATILLENGGQRNSQEENEINNQRLTKKNSCFVASFVGVWAIKPNLWLSICNMKFVQHI
jgi:hypothetical protein